MYVFSLDLGCYQPLCLKRKTTEEKTLLMSFLIILNVLNYQQFMTYSNQSRRVDPYWLKILHLSDRPAGIGMEKLNQIEVLLQ